MRELLAGETLGEKVGHVLIRADVKHTKNAVFDEVTQSIPTGRQGLRVEVDRRVVGSENCALVVANIGGESAAPIS